MTILRADATPFRPHTFGHLEQSHFKQEQGHLVQAGAFLAPGSSYQLPAFICVVLGTHCSTGTLRWDARDLFWLFLCPLEPIPRTESAHERVKEGPLSRVSKQARFQSPCAHGMHKPVG